MTEHIRFHFDPVCPRCYQTSRWLKRVAELGEVELSWALFSLELHNAGEEPEHLAEAHSRSKLALSTAVAVRDVAGSRALGSFYGALGLRVHEDGEELNDATTVKSALDDIALEPCLVDRAAAERSYSDRVAAEHRALVRNQQTRQR